MHQIVILIAEYLILVSVILTGGYFLKLNRDNQKRFIMEALAGAVLAVVFAKIASKLYNDPRPFVAGHYTPYFTHSRDNGFPSDHTLLSSLLGFVVLKYNKKVGYVLLALATLIGTARVIAGVHHVIDIVAAFAISALAVWVAQTVIARVYHPKMIKD